MSVPALVSLLKVKEEIKECQENCEQYGWVISSIDETNQTFTVLMTSPIDKEVYELYFKFDNYPEYPYFIDFTDPQTRQTGTAHAYPKGKTDSFFHAPRVVICHPCSRKSYKGYTGLHSEWELIGWQSIANGLVRLNPILEAIYARITDNTFYDGRMA